MMPVVLQVMAEEHQSCLIHNSTLTEIATIRYRDQACASVILGYDKGKPELAV